MQLRRVAASSPRANDLRELAEISIERGQLLFRNERYLAKHCWNASVKFMYLQSASMSLAAAVCSPPWSVVKIQTDR
eukprot:5901156-Pyramimonas_sp.AAC.1